MMMMSFICSCRNKKIGAKLHIYLRKVRTIRGCLEGSGQMFRKSRMVLAAPQLGSSQYTFQYKWPTLLWTSTSGATGPVRRTPTQPTSRHLIPTHRPTSPTATDYAGRLLAGHQQTAPPHAPQPLHGKDVTVYPHQPGARQTPHAPPQPSAVVTAQPKAKVRSDEMMMMMIRAFQLCWIRWQDFYRCWRKSIKSPIFTDGFRLIDFLFQSYTFFPGGKMSFELVYPGKNEKTEFSAHFFLVLWWCCLLFVLTETKMSLRPYTHPG